MTALRITPLAPALGAQVTGLDLRQPLDPAVVDTLRAAWLEHIVLLFPDQPLGQDQQLAFAARFGTVGTRATPPDRRHEQDDYDGAIMLVSNIRDDKGVPIGSLPDGEMWFHHDMSYRPEPHKATLLNAVELPDEGGHTKFANMYLAYDNIPAALKQKLAGRRVLQIYDFAMTEKVDIDGGLEAYQHQWQPIFIAHPDTGRVALYVSRLISALIEGLPRAESDAVLADLLAIAEDPAIGYEHVWRAGDLAMWDNRCSIHARTDFPRDQRRLLRRCTVEGGPMTAAAA